MHCCLLLGTGPGMNWKISLLWATQPTVAGAGSAGTAQVAAHPGSPTCTNRNVHHLHQRWCRNRLPSLTTETLSSYKHTQEFQEQCAPKPAPVHTPCFYLSLQSDLNDSINERPLAASALWAAKQPSREHIMERACVS